MKKINLLLLFVSILGLTFISSCKPEGDQAKPTIDFIAEGGSITADKTDLELDHEFQFIINVDQSIDTKKNLKTFKVTSISNDATKEDTIIENINSDHGKYTFTFHTGSTNSTDEVFTFILTDKAGVSVSKTIKVTTKAAPTGNPISTYTATLLGGQSNSSVGSFLDVSSNTVHLQASANTNSADIDLIYFYGGSNLATIVAPSDTTVSGAPGMLDLAENFTTKNATIINTSSVSVADFDAFTTDLDFPADVTGINTKTNQLAINDVLEFKTVNGKIGLIKVTALTTSATGDITITIKMQE